MEAEIATQCTDLEQKCSFLQSFTKKGAKPSDKLLKVMKAEMDGILPTVDQ